MAEEHNIKVHQYEDIDQPWEESNQNDISSLDLLFTIYAKYTGALLLQKSVGDGITILTNPNYRAIIRLTSNDLSLAPNEYKYVLSAANVGSGRVYTYGIFEIAEPRVGNRPL